MSRSQQTQTDKNSQEKIALALFKEATTEERELSLVQALIAAGQTENVRTTQLRNDRFQYLKGLNDTLDKFLHSIQEERKEMWTAFDKAGGLRFKIHMTARRRLAGRKNSVAHFNDEVVKALVEETAIGWGFKKAARQFEKESKKFKLLRQQQEVTIKDDTLLSEYDQHLTSFLDGALDPLLKSVNSFQEFCQSVLDKELEARKALEARYDISKTNSNEDQPTVKKRDHVPLYKNNVYLTGFLDAIVDCIPTQSDIKDTDGKLDQMEVKNLVDYLSAHCDQRMLSHISGRSRFDGITRALKRLEKQYSAVKEKYKEFKLPEQRKQRPGLDVNHYGEILRDAHKHSVEHGKDQDFDLFDPEQIIEQVKLLIPKKSSRKTSENTETELWESQQHYIELFEKIESLLLQKANTAKENLVDQSGMHEVVEELVNLKEKITEPELRRINAQLKRDRLLGNVALETHKGIHGHIKLKRVAASAIGVTYEDVVGASWKQVTAKLEQLFSFSDRSYFDTHLSARGKQNGNMLVVGPYGCGKDWYWKAAMADPRLITVSTSTDRLQSYWMGQTENNGRELYERAHEQRIKYDKPTVIGFAEFDAVFNSKENSVGDPSAGTHRRLQKILQDVLEGQVVYDGVYLMGFLNEPQNIPVPIFRRFKDNLVIIEALTADERQNLVTQMFDELPLAENFYENVDWDHFRKQTDYASADLLGIIYDVAREEFKMRLEENKPEILDAANKEAKELVLDGKVLSAADRKSILQKHAADFPVTAEDFYKGLDTILKSPSLRLSMRQQKKYYSELPAKFKKAFGQSL